MILIIDDLAIFREPIAACLRLAGYETACAPDGKQGLAIARARRPDLILLDVAMPGMDGLTFLTHLRNDPSLSGVPVLMLTAISERESVVQAIRLGARDYLLKSQFSTKDLLERVTKNLPADAIPKPRKSSGSPARTSSALAAAAAKPGSASPASAAKEPAGAAAVATPATPVAAPTVSPVPQPPTARIKPLDRDQCVRRAQEAVQAKTLSGVVGQVMALASSPRGDMKELASFIARDPMLSARVLATANSAAYSPKQGMVATIAEAVKRVGFNTVRNIAVAVGIFDAMPRSGADGFNPIRCWQHSFAVAQLCEQIEQLTSEDTAPLAYVVGLCHELGELLLRAEFSLECQQLAELQAQTQRPMEELEREMLGLTRRQLKASFIASIGLPESIRLPIEAYQRGTKKGGKGEHLAEVLSLADSYANSLLLATGPGEALAPFARSECRAVTGVESPARPETDQFRANICALTAMLAKLAPAEESQLMSPLFPQQNVRVWLVREKTFSEFDPIQTALDCLAKVQVHDRLPQPSEADQFDALALVTEKPSSRDLSTDAVAKAAARGEDYAPILWLTRSAEQSAPAHPICQPRQWPVSLTDLANFVASAKGVAAIRRAA